MAHITNANVNSLLDVGIKKELLSKLDKSTIGDLLSYLINNFKVVNLLQALLTIASLEMRGKKGAAYLAAHNLASLQQLKNLSAKDIQELKEEHLFNQDAHIVAKRIKELLIAKQQERIFIMTNGLRGEVEMDYHAHNH